jgi:hypothetical protein
VEGVATPFLFVHDALNIFPKFFKCVALLNQLKGCFEQCYIEDIIEPEPEQMASK